MLFCLKNNSKYKSFIFSLFGGNYNPNEDFQSQFVKLMIRVSDLHDGSVQEKHITGVWLTCKMMLLWTTLSDWWWHWPLLPSACWDIGQEVGGWLDAVDGLQEGQGLLWGSELGWILTLDLSLACEADYWLSKSCNADGNLSMHWV